MPGPAVEWGGRLSRTCLICSPGLLRCGGRGPGLLPDFPVKQKFEQIRMLIDDAAETDADIDQYQTREQENIAAELPYEIVLAGKFFLQVGHGAGRDMGNI